MKNELSKSLVSLIILVVVGFGASWLMSKTSPTPPPPPPTNSTDGTVADYVIPSNFVPAGPKPSGIVAWNKVPQKIEPFLELADWEGQPRDTSNSFDQYFKVGTFLSGPYKGGDLLFASVSCDGPCPNSIYRFARLGAQLTLLGRYSDTNDSNTITSPFSIDRNFVIPELEYPDTLYTPAGNKILHSPDNFWTRENIWTTNQSDLTFLYNDPVWGAVFTDTEHKPWDNRTSSTPGLNGMYLRALDGTIRIYKPQFIDIPGYYNVTVGGCGTSNYLAIAGSWQIKSDSELTQVGTQSGHPIYQLKDQNNQLLKDMFDNMANVNYTGEPKPAMTYEEFLATKPLLFAREEFGRLVIFTNDKFKPLAECAKPVIYLYPTSTTKVSVQLAPVGGFTYTEPAYNGGWQVTASPDGKLVTSDGKVYPYLFWEGRGGIYQTPDKGFVVKQSEVESFLASSLTKLGLNGSERKDFITYWLPQMQSAPYYFITFMGNSVADELAPLSVTPKPDTIIRILMDFKPLSAPISAQGYELHSIPRMGFTVIEWGGVKH